MLYVPTEHVDVYMYNFLTGKKGMILTNRPKYRMLLICIVIYCTEIKLVFLKHEATSFFLFLSDICRKSNYYLFACIINSLFSLLFDVLLTKS